MHSSCILESQENSNMLILLVCMVFLSVEACVTCIWLAQIFSLLFSESQTSSSMQKLVLFMVILLVGACVINDVAEAKKKGGTMLYQLMKKVPIIPVQPRYKMVQVRESEKGRYLTQFYDKSPIQPQKNSKG